MRPQLDLIMEYESGTLSREETVELFQHLVDTGLAWQLQGHYGRTARTLIDAGLVHVTYKIVRFYEDKDMHSETIATGLTLEQAQAHCEDPETSSRTATGKEARARTERYGRWFDGYEQE